MKRIIATVIILIFSLSIGIFTLFFVENTCQEAISGVDGILENAVTESREEVNRLAVQTNRNWHKKVFLLNILIGRASTNDIDKSLNKIIYFSEISDYESVILNAEDCKEELLYIIQSNELNLSTIF